MSRVSHFHAAAFLAFLTLPALSVGAMAQTSPMAASPAPAAAAAAPAMSKSMSGQVEQHIKQLHDQLHITAAEQPAWEAFAQVMRDNAADMSQAFADRGGRFTAMNAADNMQSYAQLAQVHATNTQKLASAFVALYNSFPDDQKHIADAVFRHNNGHATPQHH